MKRGVYSGLETSVQDYGIQFRSPADKATASASSPYRSQSEAVVADILESNGIRFGYEDDLHVPKKYTSERTDRIWHPDFHLYDSGIIVEYVGRTDDPEYMKGIDKKRIVYEKMGLTVVWLYPDDLWERTGDNPYGKLRDDVEEQVISKIDKVVKGGERLRRRLTQER